MSLTQAPGSAALSEEWRRILRALEQLVPVRGVVVYGSRWTGTPTPYSDYDILAVVNDPALVGDLPALNKAIRAATGFPVDLNVGTARGIRFRALVDPYVRHCLATGLLLGEVPEISGPLSRQGATDALLTLQLDLEDADEFSGMEKAAWLERIAKRVTVLEQVLSACFDASRYAFRVAQLTQGTPQRVVQRLRKAVRQLQSAVAQMAPNEGDRELVEMVAANGRALQ